MSGLNLPITASVPADLANSGDGARLFRELSTALQNQLSPVVVGVFSARPAPGVTGRRYFATDTTTVYEDTGSAWLQTYPAAVAGATGIVFGGDTTLNRRIGNQLGMSGGFAAAVGAVSTQDAFATFPAGSADYPFVVRADGRIRWGSGATSPDTNLYRSGVSALKTDGSITATAFPVASDARLKKNVETVNGGLEKALALRGVEFDWRDKKRGKTRRIGFIAQEVEKVIPGAATEEPDGTLTLNHADVLPVLVEAVKELAAKLDAALARVALLEEGSA